MFEGVVVGDEVFVEYVGDVLFGCGGVLLVDEFVFVLDGKVYVGLG